jgi:serine phosphatase RsbU (regulator of sigma subunit)
MIYTLLTAKQPLVDVADAANRFLCSRNLAGKYATVAIARLKKGGDVEYIRCGHVPAVQIHSDGVVSRWSEGTLPVGLIAVATYESGAHKLKPGERLILVSDGITEAENANADLFGEERLESACCSGDAFEEILREVKSFRAETPANDDTTILELTYLG